MRQLQSIWVKPEYAQQPLAQLREYYVTYLEGRANAAAPGTVRKNVYTIKAFAQFLASAGEEAILANLTAYWVNRWVAEQRGRGLAEDGTASRLAALKAFSHKYIYLELELTTADLLAKVARINPPAKPFPRLTAEEVEAVLGAFDRPTYEDVRNRAFVACLLATGRRLSELLGLQLSEVSLVSGEIKVVAKGGDTQLSTLSPGALRFLKAYLRLRPEVPGQQLWLTGDGRPFTFGAAEGMFQALKRRSGVGRLHAHLLRHTFAQAALEKGAERALVQDMLGHKTDVMSRRYAGAVRQQTAAKQTPKYSLV